MYISFNYPYPLSDVDYRDVPIRHEHGERHDEDVSFRRFGVAIAAAALRLPGGCEVTDGHLTRKGDTSLALTKAFPESREPRNREIRHARARAPWNRN